MLQLRRDQLFQFADDLVDAFRRKVEFENFYRDESIAVGIIRTKYRSQSTIADLMEHAKRTEGIRRRGAGSFRVQSTLL